MRIDYNVRGEQRKSLAAAISQELQVPAQYKGAPSFSYQIGDLSLDKNGVLEGADNHDLIADLQGLHGFIPASEEYDEADDSPEWHDTCDREDRDEYGNWDGNETPYYREPRHTEEEFGLGVHRVDLAGENGMQASDVPETDDSIGLAIEIPRSSFTDTALDNLKRMVDSKATLIKKALGADNLEIELAEETIRFPWFNRELTTEEIGAYAHFIGKLLGTAKSLKRAGGTERPAENEKYAFRCFLLRLGFIGDVYKKERRVLLSRLEGSSAYKSEKAEEHGDE